MAIYADVITLVQPVCEVNAYGDMVATETTASVYAEVVSIGQREFYQAAADGFKPEVKFLLASFADYADQPVVRWQPYGAAAPNEYKVIRTYRAGERIELTCQRGVD